MFATMLFNKVFDRMKLNKMKINKNKCFELK